MDKRVLARELLKISKSLLAMDFPTQDAYDNYLREHPDADRSNHRVVETKKEEQKNKEEPKRSPKDFSLKTFMTKNPKVKEAIEVFKKGLDELQGMAEKGESANETWQDLEKERVSALQKRFPSQGYHSLSEEDKKEYDKIEEPFVKKQKEQKEILEKLDKRSAEIHKEMNDAADKSEYDPLEGSVDRIEFRITMGGQKNSVSEIRSRINTVDLMGEANKIREKLIKGKKVKIGEVGVGDAFFNGKSVFKVTKITSSGRIKAKDITRKGDVEEVMFNAKSFPSEAQMVEKSTLDDLEDLATEWKSRG